ncbi:hypothetical protein ABVT39_020065 [Epinephelus coioides]
MYENFNCSTSTVIPGFLGQAPQQADKDNQKQGRSCLKEDSEYTQSSSSAKQDEIKRKCGERKRGEEEGSGTEDKMAVNREQCSGEQSSGEN